jgi:hypothetical protein
MLLYTLHLLSRTSVGKLERLARSPKSGQQLFQQRLFSLLQLPRFKSLDSLLSLCSAAETENASTGCSDEAGVFDSLDFPIDPAISHSHYANTDLLLSIYAYTHIVGYYWVP